MDSDYIIERLRTAPYRYAAVESLRRRLENMADYMRNHITDKLKKELRKEENSDIYHLLVDLLHRRPSLSS